MSNEIIGQVRSTNWVLGSVEGNVTQVGVVHGDIHMTAKRRVRSAYLEQVRALAPGNLEGRELELAALTAFCTSESTEGGYLWLRADAWSGKSALLSWFVLNPPPLVRLVSFFVTSGLPDQNNRRSYVENVFDQLLDLAEGPSYTDLTAASREKHYRSLLATAAEKSRQRGEYFTLVVDGLDEDRGTDGSPDAYSIAGLLPAAGIRVIVASRTGVDLPEEVLAAHPLYRSAVVEYLSPSTKAGAVRDTMIRDLKRLLRGTPVQQDLLGFITVTGGGLSAEDLAELAGTSSWQVKDDLQTAAGRSFIRRPGTPPVYVLAHDDLLNLAGDMLGPRLKTYCQRLHIWADSYREREWPTNTPRYLLNGYGATLTSIGDVPRLLEYVTDPLRHELMSALTGHDHVALDEIKAAQGLLLSQAEPDLVALARLAVHRASLYVRNQWIPPHLPEAWVQVGQFDKAEALLSGIGDLVVRSRELRSTGEALHEAGEQRRAGVLLDEAEALASSYNQYWGTWPHSTLAEVAMRIGDHERARRAVNAIKLQADRAKTCASLARIALDKEGHEEADRWYLEAEEAFNEEDPHVDLTVLAEITAAATALGRSSRAAALVERILGDAPLVEFDFPGLPSDPTSVRTVPEKDKSTAADTLAAVGLAEVACSVAAKISDVDSREDCLVVITRIIAQQNLDEAEQLARSASDVSYRSSRLAAVAVAAGRKDDQSRATRLLVEIDDMLHGHSLDQWPRFAIMATAVALADSGAIERAESMVHSEMLPSEHTAGALSVAVALIRRNEVGRASRIVASTEKASRLAAAQVDERRLLRWVGVLADFGEFDRAEQLVRSFPTDVVRSTGLATITERAVIRGALDRAQRTFPTIDDARLQRRPLLELTRALLAQGEQQRAVELAMSTTAPAHRAAALTFIAATSRTPKLLDDVMAIADEVAGTSTQGVILLPALRAAADLGDRARATVLWQRIQAVVEHAKRQPLETDEPLRHLHLPSRLRTLTEISDLVDGRSRFSAADEIPDLGLYGPESFWHRDKHPSKWVQLAHDLATHDWFDLVDDLVEVEQATFQAIMSELDRLGRRGVLHPRAFR
ncbi:hypothetical protein [Umezawaea sp. Da 62-37]|uniref:hypothetical protein n=1 Tax=Umezawaea sp. Da 62-37 TaxID=3075927 RepID=UPI0028F6F5F3|nr:hypothetical protein [Umezawaea sp. Da 62-37]WNV84889.1 hypothetical protein RM788_43140 [Umezawaea sp. Da 62-37]